MNFIQKIEIFENEKPRADKGFDSPLKIALLVFGLPGLVMLLIMCLILPSKIEYVAKGEPVKAELISASNKGSRFSFAPLCCLHFVCAGVGLADSARHFIVGGR